MKPEFRNLRIKQLSKSVEPFLAVKGSARPARGWIRAIREITGISLREMAERMGTTSSAPASFERSEAESRITLKTLRDAANALGCDLVYAFVPKQGSLQDLVATKARTRAYENVVAVEHTMALEDQGVGGIQEKVKEETSRLLKKLK